MGLVAGTNGQDWLGVAKGVTEGADQVHGFDGDDTMFGHGGNDLLVGGKGADDMHGGNGIDTASYETSEQGVYVDLYGGFGLYGDAWGDTLDGIENLIGSSYDDTLVGDEKANVLEGRNGNDNLLGLDGDDTLWGQGDDDNLYGHDGSDTLYGGTGEDRLDGGSGRDVMYGGAHADTFEWNAASETGLNMFTADRIMDFNAAQGDLIDLSGIDANVYAAGNQAFTFIGNAAFSGAPGEVRYYHGVSGNTYLQIQTGTSVDIEGLIRIDGIHVPDASWFVL